MAIDYEATIGTGDEDDPAQGGGYRQEPFFILKKGETAYLRFLQESSQWVKGLTHVFPVAKAAPKDHEGKWPEFMSATCRQDEMLASYYPDGCPICKVPGTNKFNKTWERAAQVMRYTLAVEREQYESDQRRPDGKPVMLTRDKTVKIPVFDPDSGKAIEGETIEVPSIVIVSGTMYQMFSSLKAIGASYGSLTNCDFKISRIDNPSGNGTIYQILPVMENTGVAPGTEHWEMYENAVKLWTPKGLRLKQLIGERSEEGFYDRFFTTNGVVLKHPGGGTQAASGTSAATGPQQANPDMLQAMKDRIAKQQGAAPAPAE